jgi:hypothetical protein
VSSGGFGKKGAIKQILENEGFRYLSDKLGHGLGGTGQALAC